MLYEQLTALGAYPVVENGDIVRLVRNDKQIQQNVELTTEEYDSLGLTSDCLGTVEEHPEGAKRYVPTLSDGASTFYDDTAGEWFPGTDDTV